MLELAHGEVQCVDRHAQHEKPSADAAPEREEEHWYEAQDSEELEGETENGKCHGAKHLTQERRGGGMALGMPIFRTILNFVVAGALLGALAVTLIGPSYIQWDSTSGSGTDPRCLCAETARQGADRIIDLQVKGVATGSALGIVVGIAVARRKKRVAPAAPATPTPNA